LHPSWDTSKLDSKKHMVSTRHMMSTDRKIFEYQPKSNTDQLEMVAKLWRELETLKRKNVEEIGALRAENVKIKQKLEDSDTCEYGNAMNKLHGVKWEPYEADRGWKLEYCMGKRQLTTNNLGTNSQAPFHRGNNGYLLLMQLEEPDTW